MVVRLITYQAIV